MQSANAAHSLSKVPSIKAPRASFNRSHGLKTTFDAGGLVPIFCDEVLPGDTFNLKTTGFARLATPIHPIMDNMFMETFYFFVPHRLVWDNFQKMMGERIDPTDSIDYSTPTMGPTTTYGEHSIFDYLGLPTKESGFEHSSIPLRAYNLIWNDWFRDENLQDSLTVLKSDSSDPDTTYVIQPRGKRHDYFTSCLTSPQKGDPVSLPLGTTAPVIPDGSAFKFTDDGGNERFITSTASAKTIEAQTNWGTSGTLKIADSGLVVDLTNATAATINDLRYSFAAQEFLERDSRGGTRYTEIINSHFGVTSPDSRLQRPEYLGGGSTPININPVTQTSSTDATTPQGNLSAFGTTSFNNHGFTKSFTEHGTIIGLVNVRADLTYQQGLHKMWSRGGRFDYYWPDFAHLGEQAVLNKEIFCDGTVNDDGVFGYQERWAEYRYKPSQITGQFRSNATTSLDSWHLSTDFASVPSLNADFIEDNPPIDRVIAVPSEPHFLLDLYHSLNCARPMPMFSIPGLGSKF